MDYTFAGRLNWTGAFTMQCLATDIQADALEKAIYAACPNLSPTEKSAVESLAVMLSCFVKPVEAKWTDGEPTVLVDFAIFINGYKEHTLEELWLWRRNMPYQLYKSFSTAFDRSQDLFPVPLAQVPTVVLTDEQKADPNLK